MMGMYVGSHWRSCGKSGMLSAMERNENKPKNPSRITLTRALIAIFLLCLILLWFFGVFLRRR